MEVILWGIFIITTLLGACIMMIQENPERYNRYIVEYGIGLFWVIMYIYLLDVYFLGIYYKKFLITLIALTILFSIFSSFYYEEGRDYEKNEKIVLSKDDEVITRKYLKFFYRKLDLSTALIPINRGMTDFIIVLFETQFLLLIFILRFSDILLKINHIFYNLLFFLLLFFIEKRLLKVIIRYKDYIWARQVLRYFMFISVIVLYINCAFLYDYKNVNKNSYHSQKISNKNYSQPQAQQEEVKPTVVENNNVNTYIPTVEDARYVNYKTYYNDNFDYSIDYPDDEYFQISKTYEDGMKLQNDNGEVIISLTSNWNPNGESLQQAYDKAVREKPNAPYKFLGKTFFTITYEDNGLLIFRKTMYDKDTNKYVYLYVSFPPEYKPYMTPIVERMANSMKKSSSTQSKTNTSNVTYSNYYNSYYGYSVDYPTSSDFYISSNTNDGIEIKSNDENVYISVVYNYDEYGDNLQQAYNRAVSEYPNAPYKFLGKTFFTITYEENGLLVFRKTVYDKINNGYIYLYVSFPPEYKEYMSPIVEKMANTMKKR